MSSLTLKSFPKLSKKRVYSAEHSCRRPFEGPGGTARKMAKGGGGHGRRPTHPGDEPATTSGGSDEPETPPEGEEGPAAPPSGQDRAATLYCGQLYPVIEPASNYSDYPCIINEDAVRGEVSQPALASTTEIPPSPPPPLPLPSPPTPPSPHPSPPPTPTLNNWDFQTSLSWLQFFPLINWDFQTRLS